MNISILLTLKNIYALACYYFIGTKTSRKTVSEIPENPHDITKLIIETADGLEIRLICKQIRFVIKNDSKFIPYLYFSNYRVFVENANDLPKALREILSKDIHLPNFKSMFMTEHRKRKLLIEAYIDVVTNGLE